MYAADCYWRNRNGVNVIADSPTRSENLDVLGLGLF